MVLAEGLEWRSDNWCGDGRLRYTDKLKEFAAIFFVAGLHISAMSMFLMSSDTAFVSGQLGTDDRVTEDDAWSVVAVEYLPEVHVPEAISFEEIATAEPVAKVVEPERVIQKAIVEPSLIAEPAPSPLPVEAMIEELATPSQPVAAQASSGVPVEVKKNKPPEWIDEASFSVRPKQPRYPALAKRRGQEGLVMLEIWIDEQGEQTSLSVQQSSGFSLLDEAALKAASQWRFKPYLKSGLATASRVLIPLEFSIY